MCLFLPRRCGVEIQSVLCLIPGVIAMVIIVSFIMPVAVVGAGLEVFAVEDEAQQFHAGHLRAAQGLADLPVVGVVLPDHEDRAGRLPGQGQGVGDDVDRRGVEQHQIIGRFQLADQLVHGGGLQQLRGVRRQVASREDVQVLALGVQNSALPLACPDQRVGKAREVRIIVEDIPLAGAPHVRVDQEDPLARHAEGDRQVGRDGGLAFAGDRAGDHHGVALLLHQGVDQVHAELGVALDHIHRALAVEQEAARVFVLLLVALDGGQDGDGVLLPEFLGFRDLLIEQEDQREKGGPDRGPADGARHALAALIAGIGRSGQLRGVDHLSLAGIGDFRQLLGRCLDDGVADVHGAVGIGGGAAHLGHRGLILRPHGDGTRDGPGREPRIFLGEQLGLAGGIPLVVEYVDGVLQHLVHDALAAQEDAVGTDQLDGAALIGNAVVAVVLLVRIVVGHHQRAARRVGVRLLRGPVVHKAEADGREQDPQPAVLQQKQGHFDQVDPGSVLFHARRSTPRLVGRQTGRKGLSCVVLPARHTL